jgi:hypothetical protein
VILPPLVFPAQADAKSDHEKRRYNIQYVNSQYNDTQHNGLNWDTQHNDIQHYGTQHKHLVSLF